MMDSGRIIARLEKMANPANAAGMARYGINPEGVLGVSMPELRAMAKETGKNHVLAISLWDSGMHEARILASLLDDASEVTPSQMEAWVKEFNSWDICDQVCSNLFQKTPYAVTKALEWSRKDAVFVKRAGFVLMARIAVADRKAQDSLFEQFFPLIIEESADDRPMAKKAVNWAIRQIGKRNIPLNIRAIEICGQIKQSGTKAGRWIASDALRELTGASVQERLLKKALIS